MIAFCLFLATFYTVTDNTTSMQIKLLLHMFNQFPYLFNHLLVLNKQNTDNHAVCNAGSTLTP